MRILFRACALFALFLVPSMILSASVRAAPIHAPVPDNAMIHYRGLDWAWGGACAASAECGEADLSYQSTQGWRLPTLAELLALPAEFASLFRFAGANAPFLGTEAETEAYFSGNPGGDAACASAWFSTTQTHCDWNDGVIGGWAGLIDSPYAEQLYVRGLLSSPVVVAEPAILSVLCLGLAAMAASGGSRARRILAARSDRSID